MKLKIGHFKVTVSAVEGTTGMDARAVFDPERMTIEYQKKATPGERLELLLHELLHASALANGWHDRKLTEEEAVAFASRSLAQLLIDNEAELLGFIGSALRDFRKD